MQNDSADEQYWYCPRCAHVITDLTFTSIRVDVRCPTYNGANFSEFHLSKQIQNKPCGPVCEHSFEQVRKYFAEATDPEFQKIFQDAQDKVMKHYFETGKMPDLIVNGVKV